MKRVIQNRVLVFLLTFVMMIVTVFPTMVFAKDGESEPADIVTVTIMDADIAETSEEVSAIEAALSRQGISNIKSITALKVITEGSAYLSPRDNRYLKNNFTSLVYLDESKCACSTKNLTENYLVKSGLPDKKYKEFGGLAGFSSLSTLIIPDEAQIINSYQVCKTGLTTLTIPNNVLIIENGAFSNNTDLISRLTIPDSVIFIGNNAFGAETTKINSEELILGNSVKYIDNNAFAKRVFSGDLIIPDSVETIGNWVFESGSFEDGTWKLGTGLCSVGDAAMSNICSGNRGSLFIPSQLATKDTCFGYNTFSEVVFEEGTVAIGTRVVRNSEKIANVVLPSTLKTIGGQAFFNCSALRNVVFPNGLESIGSSSFDGTNILGIYIPDTVTTINVRAFEKLPQRSVLYAPNNDIYQLLIKDNNAQWERRYDKTKTALAITNGGMFLEDTIFNEGILEDPIKEGYIFDGWYDNESFNGESVIDIEPGKTYYAKWIYPEEKPGSDKEDLAALIKYAQDAKNAENYKYVVPKVKKLFEKALEDAIAVNVKKDATQKEIDDAYDALLAKVHLLDFTGNTESLKVLIDAAETKYQQEEMYTKESWAPFAKAFEAAKELLKDENALQVEIDAAREALQAAMDALVLKPIDTKKLEKLIADSKQYEDKIDKYTSDSAKAFMAALDGAREVLASEKITQEAVDSAYKTLLNAIFGLREVPNKDRLEELLGKVEAMDLSAYSEETASAVKAAVAMAAAVMEDENANQEQVDAAVAALEEAVASLEAKEEVGTGDINTDNTEDTSGEDENSVTDKKVVSNDEGSKDTANKTTTAKTNVKTAAQTGDAAKAAVPAVAAVAALLAVWFVWKKK